MSGDIDVPGVGQVNAKWVYAGGAAVIGVVGYTYWRRRGSAAAPVDAVDQLPADGTTGDVGDGWGNVPGQTGNSTGSWVPDGERDPATPAEWTNTAIERMTSIGYDGQAVAQAIGLWLGRQSLTANQGDMIRTVKAVMPAVPGYDPEPPIQVGLPATPGTGGGGTTPPPGKPAVPPAPHLHHVLRAGKGRITMEWNAAAGATAYVVYYTGGPAAGIRGIHGTSYTITGLPSGRLLHFSVASTNAAGRSARTSNVVPQTVQ